MGEHCDFENEHMPWLREMALRPRKSRNKDVTVALNPEQHRAYRSIGGAPVLKRLLLQEFERQASERARDGSPKGRDEDSAPQARQPGAACGTRPEESGE